MENNELVPINEDVNFDGIGEPKEQIIKHKGGRKSTGPQFQQRVDEAIEMILYKGYGHEEFCKIYTHNYNVSFRTAQKVWAICKDILKKRSEAKQEEIISNQIGRYMDLLERAREDGNKRVEREVLWDLSRITGLDQRKIDITSNGEKLDIKINLSNQFE
jgi:hypothetical protein